jgi:hypothetical protein
MFGIEIIANCLIIKIFVPVNVHGAGNMAGIIKQYVFVALNNTDIGIVQMLGDPIRIYQCFWVGVFAVADILILCGAHSLFLCNSIENRLWIAALLQGVRQENSCLGREGDTERQEISRPIPFEGSSKSKPQLEESIRTF